MLLTPPRSRCCLAAFCILLAAGSAAPAAEPVTSDMYVSGRDGYHTYRIPALLVSPKGTLLAFCEGRKTGRGDAGDIDLVLRRSTDGGRTWLPQSLVYEEGGAQPITIGNPCPVVDQSTGVIWLPFCRNNERVFVTSSSDDGITWTEPREITADVKAKDWGWYATGPGVGIQIKHGPHAGRLVIPCDHRADFAEASAKYSHVFHSDDHGQSWRLGGTVDAHTDECQVVELAGGRLLINMRNYWARDGKRPELGGVRAVAHSDDGGATWSKLRFDRTLIEPVCQASLIAIDRPATSDDGASAQPILIFSNPASSQARRNMTVRASFDGGRTWPVSRLLGEGPAAYSCLAQLSDGQIGLLVERDDYRRIEFCTVPLDLTPPAGQ